MFKRTTLRLIMVLGVLFAGGWLSDGLFAQTETCPVSNQLDITVHPEPTISITGATTICADGTATLNATIGNGTGTCTIQWQNSPDGTTWSDISGANAAAYTTPALTTTTHYRARYTCDGSDCDPATSNPQIITVNPDPTVALSIDPFQDTICSGGVVLVTATVTNGIGTLTYQWQIATAPGGPWTNVGTNSNTYTSAALTQTSYIKVIITQSGVGCDGTESAPLPVVVIPDPSIVICCPQTICVGGNADLTAVVSNGTGTCGIQWQISDNTITWTDIAGATSANLNTGALSTSKFYRAIYSCNGLQCDAGTSNVVQISVTADPSVSVAGGEVTICAGGGATLTASVTGGAGTASYQWQISTDNVTFTDISGETNPALTVVGLTTTTYYRVRVTFSGSGCDPVYSGVSTINVVPDPVITISGANSICVGGNDTLSAVVTGGTGTCTIHWQQLVGASWLDISPAQTTDTYITPALTVTQQYRVRFSCTGGGCDATFSPAVSVIVVPDPTFTLQPDGADICVGGTHTMTATAADGVPPLTYQWQYFNGTSWANVANGTPAGSTYTGQTTTSFTVAGISAVGTYQYRAVAQSVGSGCDPVASGTADVNVVKDPVVDTQPVGADLCVGGSHTLSVVASGGTPDLQYQWQYSANNTTWANVSAGTPAGGTYSGENTENLDISGITATGTYYYRVQVSSTGSDCNTTYSNAAIITIYDAPAIGTLPPDVSICVGGTTTFTVPATGGATALTYQWQFNNGGSWENVAAGSPAGSTYTGATTNTITIAGVTVVAAHQYRILVSSGGSACATQASSPITMTVVPDPSIAGTPDNAAICVGGSTTMDFTASGGTPSLNYQWEYLDSGLWLNVANGTPSGATYTGATTNTLQVDGITLTGTFQYRLKVTASGSDCNTAYSQIVNVTVVADPLVTVQPIGATLCEGGSHTMSITATGGTPSLDYQWQFSADGSTWNNVVAGTPTGATYTGANTNSLTVNGVTALGNHQYRAVVSATGSGCATVASNPATITVNPALVVDNAGMVNATICVGGSHDLEVVVSGGIPPLVYQWQYSADNSTWSNAVNATPTGAAYTIVDNQLSVTGISALGNHYYRVLITSTGSNCNAQQSANAIVTVVADPLITAQPNSDTICIAGTFTSTLTATNGTPSLNYAWQYFDGSSWSAVANGTPAGATYTGNNTNSMTVAGVSVAGTYQYRNIVSATGSGCDPTVSASAYLIVRPDPAVSIVAAGGNICPGGNIDLTVSATGGTPTLTYQWQYSADGSTGWANVANGTPGGSTYTGATGWNLNVAGITLPGSYHYRTLVNATGSGCGQAVSGNMTVVVIPEVTATFAVTEDTICYEGTTIITATVGGGTGTLSYQWQMKPASGSWANVADAGAPILELTTPELTETTNFRLLVSSTGSGCDDFVSTETTIVVVPDPTIGIVGVEDVCIGGSTTATATISGGTGTCQIQWQVSNDGTIFSDIVPPATGPTYTTPALSTNKSYRAKIVCSGNGCCD